jgi:hypothetical protein
MSMVFSYLLGVWDLPALGATQVVVVRDMQV